MKIPPFSLSWLHGLSRLQKQLLMALTDITLLSFSVWAAYTLRFSDWFVPDTRQWLVIVAAPLIAIPVFIRVGLYRSVIRYVGEKALWAVVKGMSLSTLVWTAGIFLIDLEYRGSVPRSVPLLYWLVGTFLVGGSRFFARWLLWQPIRQKFSGKQVLIYGAGRAGRELARSLRESSELLVAAFIDDDADLHGRDIDGVRVYKPKKLAWLIDHYEIRDVILTESSFATARRKDIIGELQHFSVTVRVLPSIAEIASGRYMVQSLRELDIADLLGREPVALSPALTMHSITAKTVLITGAGGSIGAELCRQILAFKPATLLLVDHSEYNLYLIHTELQKLMPEEIHTRIVPLLGNVCDHARMSEIMAEWKPQTIYHAAAYKHVPLVESNIAEGIRNNVLGTLQTARAAMEHGIADFVLVSTDKAVRPTNIMGASKRLAEMVLQALAAESQVTFETQPLKNQTRFCMVRFGNVLGSSGSVVPLFKQQIKEGGPITLTHADIVRYFMTIPEAAQLVIQAGAMAEGGDVFILDMGEAVKIIDLARRMVELSGLSVKDKNNLHGDIEIIVTGLRPGEKLYEELLLGNNPVPTVHPRIMKAHEAAMPWKELQSHLKALARAIELKDERVMRYLLKTLVTGYQPTEEKVIPFTQTA